MPDPVTAESVAASVRAEMARKKISGRRLARELDMSHRILSTRLAGQSTFRADELSLIAAHLKVPITRFFAEPVREAS